jgi:hypothetical protein
MSTLDTAINGINTASNRANATTEFYDDILTGDDLTNVTNPNNDVSTPTIAKQIKEQVTANEYVTEAIQNAGWDVIGDFADLPTVNDVNDVLTSKSVSGNEDALWRTNQALPYTPTGTDPTQSPELGKWVAVAQGEIKSIARSLNVADSAVIYSTDTVTQLDNVLYIYDASTQTTWGKPSGVGAGETITDVTGSALTTSGGSYTLVNVVTNNIAYSTVASMKDGSGIASSLIDDGDLKASTIAYYNGWAAQVEPQGGADYILTTRQNVRDAKYDQSWVPDGFADHYLFGGTTYVAMLQHDGVTENTAKWGHDGTNLDSIISAITTYAQAKSTRLLIEVDSDSVLSAGITVDTDNIAIDLGQKTLDFSSVTGNAILISGSGAPGYENAIAAVKNGVVFGSRVSGKTGVAYDSDTANASTRSYLRDIVLHDFEYGISYLDRAYLVKNNNITIYNCDFCVSDVGGTDAGENLTFVDSSFFNSTLAIEAKNVNGSIQLINTSIDYNGQAFDVNGSVVIMRGGHLEDSNSSRRIVIAGNGGAVYIDNAVIVRASGSNLTDYYAEVAAGCILSISGGSMENTESDTGEFYTGDGVCEINLTQGRNQHGNNIVLGQGASLMSNPTFASLKAHQFLISAGTLTDIHNGSVYTLAATANELVGNKSSGGTARWGISAAVSPNDQIGYRFDYDNTASSGDIFVNARWAILRDIDGIVTLDTLEEAHGSLTLSNGASGTREIPKTAKYRAPAWATHVVIYFNSDAQTTGTDFKVSNCYITKIS